MKDFSDPQKVIHFSLIPPLPRNNSSHPALWLLHIPFIPWDHMQMQVHHALPGRRPDVHPDIIAVGGIPLIEQPTGIMDESQEGGLLSFGRLKKRGHVPEGDEEQVAGAHRIEVIPGVGEKSLRGGWRRGRGCRRGRLLY